jgi:hypothetical protein
MSVTGSPAGIVAVGGYRFVQRTMQDQASTAAWDAALAALPDSLLHHRLAGAAGDRSAAHAALAAQDANALVVDAFGRPPRSAAA